MPWESNMHKFYIYSVFVDLLILGPILVLYMQGKGLSFTEIMTLQSVFAVAIAVFEVPTGALADRFGRKYSMALGGLAQALGLAFYIGGSRFLWFAVAETLFGLGVTLHSGADTALLYDSLKLAKREKEFASIAGRARSRALGAQALGSVASGFLFELDSELPMYVSLAFMLITTAVSLTFAEPPSDEGRSRAMASYFRQIGDGARYILGHEKVKAIILFAMVYAVFSRLAFWFYQPYMEAVGIPVRYFGVLFFVFNMVAAIASRYTDALARVTKGWSFSALAAMMIGSFTLLWAVRVWPGVAAIFLQQVARGTALPIIHKHTNKHVPSETRATILSFQSLAGSLAFAAVSPLMGIVKDHTSVFNAHIIMSVSMAVAMAGVSRYMNARMGPSHRRVCRA